MRVKSKITNRMVPVVLSFLLVLFGCSEKESYQPALIPMPRHIEWSNERYDLSDSSRTFVQRIVRTIPGVAVNEAEAYQLVVSNDSLVLTAGTSAGLTHGIQTIRQLTYNDNGKRYVAGCSVTDWPAFRIRGFMQDVGRNYQSMEMLKEQIDVLAAYKYNVFHFHVTDNPGWRLESKLYPELNAPETMSRWKGKYYTQEEFKELVDYCNERNIILIPEFDLPGHSEAFRKAFQFKSMSDPRAEQILLDLVDELAGLAGPGKMPYIHLGTDEVWHEHERPAPGLLPALLRRIVKTHNREVVVWRPGYNIDGDSVSVTQLWSSNGHPRPGHRYLDSRLNYLNHLDPLAGIPQLYYDRINGAAQGDSLRMGGILCCWNDNLVNNEYDIIRQNPVYPGIVTYSEAAWTGHAEDFGEKYLAKFPATGDEAFVKFKDFEERLIAHRDRYFRDKPFPYVMQTTMSWRIAGPFEHGGDTEMKFPPEDTIAPVYEFNAETYRWSAPITGGTVHLQHFFGYPSYFEKEEGTYYASSKIWSDEERETDVWISFHDWSRSAGRRGGPFPEQGQWHKSNPQVWVNGVVVPPPVWDNPGMKSSSDEIPFSDENYYFREPAQIKLKKGWNNILLKIPVTANTWKRMFTFIPVEYEDGAVKEAEGLKYSADLFEAE